MRTAGRWRRGSAGGRRSCTPRWASPDRVTKTPLETACADPGNPGPRRGGFAVPAITGISRRTWGSPKTFSIPPIRHTLRSGLRERAWQAGAHTTAAAPSLAGPERLRLPRRRSASDEVCWLPKPASRGSPLCDPTSCRRLVPQRTNLSCPLHSLRKRWPTASAGLAGSNGRPFSLTPWRSVRSSRR